ncbi:FAD-dependent oxidoreductase [Galbibacter sp. EGI 63066]|uniref:NAD(P)/FAD-dependent oxidoreductase n=1 Tax=Galbibacter sp. EGI 63066 TaxID=2993559 RepID=UPI0022488CD0|nr:FAD-dependent oxidoreductase [Galbibacter sp. EGI 63066]MCX2678976.1 FAD-dependent oxidoreductase [Galbibacter sp. EGI 63066]
MENSFSYWERDTYFTNIDFTVVGAGIVGLNCALELKRKHPKAKILVLERGILPKGASTKNAGFACFGSISELLDDLQTLSEEEMIRLVEKRDSGLQQLKNTLGEDNIGYKTYKGYELFLKDDPELFESCMENRDYINELLFPLFKTEVFSVEKNSFSFSGIHDHYMVNHLEGQLNTGKMMDALYSKCVEEGIKILYGVEVASYEETGENVSVKTNVISFNTKKLLLATNGFASKFVNDEIKPVRAQVLVTKPIKNLHIKGTFHLDKGYYYFRNINDRILLGGGRNLDFNAEETSEFGLTSLVQDKLKELLKTVILPQTPHEIDTSWSGIMGVGSTKEPIIKALSHNIFCGVRLGGMGIAIGAHVGKELANLTT